MIEIGLNHVVTRNV